MRLIAADCGRIAPDCGEFALEALFGKRKVAQSCARLRLIAAKLRIEGPVAGGATKEKYRLEFSERADFAKFPKKYFLRKFSANFAPNFA